MFVELLKEVYNFFEPFIAPVWMDIIKEEQRKYNKDKLLEPNDGSDWKRELL